MKYSDPSHVVFVAEEQSRDNHLQAIIKQRHAVAAARREVDDRPGAYNLSLILQQEKEKLARLLEDRWAKFGIVG